MSNPWEKVSIADYENHMKLPSVQQLQKLSKIMKSQIYKYRISTIAILGIAGGNGLGHIDKLRIKTVYGIDINKNYLDTCKEKYKNLKDCLVLKKLDSLVKAMSKIGYSLTFSDEDVLPNMKRFIRLDFVNKVN